MATQKKARSSEKRNWFKCLSCRSSFPLITVLEKHVATEHTVRKAFCCKKCTKSFRNEECLISHRSLHRAEKNTCFPCDMCDSIFTTYKGMLSHKRNVHPESLVCEICEEGCKTLKQLAYHVSDVHDEESEYNARILALQCDVCSLYFKNKTTMRNHHTKHHVKKSIVESEILPSPPDQKFSFLADIQKPKLPQIVVQTTSQSAQNKYEYNLEPLWQTVCGVCKLYFPQDCYTTHLRPINLCCRENMQCGLCKYKILTSFCEYFIHFLSSHSKMDRPMLKCTKCPMTYIDTILAKVVVHNDIMSPIIVSSFIKIKDETAFNANQEKFTNRLDNQKLKIEVVEIDLTLDDQ